MPTKPSKHLVVARISDSGDFASLEKKVVETCDRLHDLPGRETLRELGASPLNDPEAVGGLRVNGPGFHAVRFEVPGTLTTVILALGSAAKVNLGEDDNYFVTLLEGVLNEGDYHSVWVADFARLLRSIDYLSNTWRAVRNGCRYVRHGYSIIDISSPTAEIQFLFEAITAAADARVVVRRTVGGIVRAARSGRFPYAPSAVPPGYRKNKEGNIVLAGGDAQLHVRTIIELLGRPDLSDREILEHAGEVGIVSVLASRRLRRRVNVGEVNNPTSVVLRWYKQLDVWRSGTLVKNHEIPALVRDDFDDAGIEIVEREHAKYLRFTFKLDIPDGGWASDDAFEAAFEARARRSVRNAPLGGRSSSRKAFCGYDAWFDGDKQYKLLSTSGGELYELRCRPESEASVERFIDREFRTIDKGWGKSEPSRDGEQVAVIDPKVLHAAVIEGLIDQATDGLELRSLAGAVLEHPDYEALTEQLRSEMRDVKREAANARQNSLRADTDADRSFYFEAAAEAARRVAKLERELVRLVGAQVGGDMPIDAESVASTLSAVAAGPAFLPLETGDAVRQVITNLRIDPVDSDHGRWSAELNLPMAGGRLILGPATGLVRFHQRRTDDGITKVKLPADVAAQLVFRDGLSVEEACMKHEVRTVSYVKQRIRDVLEEQGMPREAATACLRWSRPSARQVLWELLQGRPAPPDFDPRFARLVRRIYLEGPVTSGSARYASNAAAVLGYIRSVGGWLADEDASEFKAATGLQARVLKYYASDRTRRGEPSVPILDEEAGGVALRRCPHPGCSGRADLFHMAPEVPTRLLCSTCFRLPDVELPDFQYPQDYRTPEAA